MPKTTQTHNELCEGHVACPITGKEECGRVVVTKVRLVQIDGETEQIEEPAAVYCFGCGNLHDVGKEN